MPSFSFPSAFVGVTGDDFKLRKLSFDLYLDVLVVGRVSAVVVGVVVVVLGG